MNFPKAEIPKSKEERKEIDRRELDKRDLFQKKMLQDMKEHFEIPTVTKLPKDIFPYSQKFSVYSTMPYGAYGTISSAGCGPLAVEFAARLLGINVEFVDIISQCVIKGYRGYLYDEQDNIIDGSGTKYSLFSNIATEVEDLNQLMEFIKHGCPITLLIQNSVYHDDDNRKGNHFITLIGIDEEKNAILMDGNLIEDKHNPRVAEVRKDFKEILPGLRGAWAWEKEKVKAYL